MALALALLAGAGMMIESFANLLHTPVGFAPDHVATAHIDLPRPRYQTQQVFRFEEELLAALSSGPTQNAALANSLPLTGQAAATVPGIERAEPRQDAAVHAVSPGYFAALKIPIRRGRLLTAADRSGNPNVVLLNETGARTLFRGENPIVKRVNLPGGWGPPEN